VKENLKIRVNDDNRQEIIDLLGKLGKSFCWDVKTRWSEIVAIFAYKKQNLEWDSDLGYNYFKGHSNKEITLTELRELAREKEHLNDKFELVLTNQPLEGWILVPDGAHSLTKHMSDDSILFWRDNERNCFHSTSTDWYEGTYTNVSDYLKVCKGNSKIIWQRESKVETVKGRFLHQEWLDLWISGCDLLFKIKSVSTWNGLSMSNALGVFNNPENEFRIKPQTIQIGSRTINKPINVKPKIKTRYFVADTGDDRKYEEWAWDDCEFDNTLLKNNVIHLTKEDAITHCEALLELMK